MKQVIAMHGWAGDSRQWSLWSRRFEQLGWLWCSGERGYGSPSAVTPEWTATAQRRLVICHSLGFHLLPASILAVASDLVLLGGFAAFVPQGPPGRRQRTALQGMARMLGTDQEAEMLRRFLERAAAPLPLSALPPNPLLKAVSETGRRRLEADLNVLASLNGLPQGCPEQANGLVVQGAQDQVVTADAHGLLVQLLSDQLETRPSVVIEADCGHALITADVLQRVLRWLDHR